jgi:hypothetical protein
LSAGLFQFQLGGMKQSKYSKANSPLRIGSRSDWQYKN